MEQTLKITNVLSDPTRFSIYEKFIEEKEPMTVAEVADMFNIHPNVARLHLTKLVEINLLSAHYRKNENGGRPSRVYELSDHVIELSFPHRDYRLLAQMMLESFVGLGEAGKKALYETGKRYGIQIMLDQHAKTSAMSVTEKIKLLEETSAMLGMFPKFNFNEDENVLHFTFSNCPIKEIAEQNTNIVCKLHNHFIKGMLQALFPKATLQEEENMLKGCEHCKYVAQLA